MNKMGRAQMMREETERVIARLQLELEAKLARESERVERFGEEGPDGTVIRWRCRFSKGSVLYHYAAIRAAGLWYTTGPRSPKEFTWDELLAWLDGLHKVKGWETWPPAGKTTVVA